MTDRLTQDVRYWLTPAALRLLEATNNDPAEPVEPVELSSRPVVYVRACDRPGRPTRHIVWCATGRCQFVYITLSATYAENRAIVHRAKHDLEDK